MNLVQSPSYKLHPFNNVYLHSLLHCTQVSHILFDVLKLTPPTGITRGKAGYYSTSAPVLKVGVASF